MEKSINPTTMPYFNGLLTQTLLYKIEGFLMIRDRGKKKWQGFFMPENIKMLKNLWLDDNKTPRPQLDEMKIEDMERLLSESKATKRILEITT
jgi:hypothetical protein